MKFVLVIANLHTSDGGPPNAVAHIARELAYLGHDVHIVTQRLRTSDCVASLTSATAAGVTLHESIISRQTKFRFSIPFLASAIAVSRQADAVSCHGFYQFPSVVAYACAVLRRTVLFVQPHGVFEPYQQMRGSQLKPWFNALVGRRIVRRADAVLVASEAEAVGVREALGRGVAKKVHVTGLGVELPRVLASPAESPQRIIYASRIAPKKRLDKLLDAFILLRESGSDVGLDVCGDGDPSILKQLVSRSIPHDAQFHGHLRGNALETMRSRATIFALVSDNENFGQAVTEAMAAGLPVLTTTTVGASEHVLKAKCGWVLTEPSASEVAEVLRAALDQPSELADLGARARDYASRNLSWSAVVKHWCGLAAAGRSTG